MEVPTKITVIIPTMNRYETLKRTIDALMLSSLLPDEVPIIDQTQVLTTAKKIQHYCGGINIIRYIKQDEPSLTKARNKGMRLARNEIIVFMDDDVDVRVDTFQILANLYKEEKVAMIAGLNVFDELQKNSALGIIFGKSSYTKRFTGHVTEALYGRFPIRCNGSVNTEWAMGFFFSVRKTYVEKWKLEFDENLQYYAYAEDMDFTYSYYKKANSEGLQCIINNRLIVQHNVSTEYRTPSRKATYMVILHRYYLSYKHFKSPMSRVSVVWSNIGDIFFRALKKESAIDVITGQLFCFKHLKDIRKGNFHYEKFM